MTEEYSGGKAQVRKVVYEEGLLAKWLSPTALVTVLAGVVWGVQLNFAVAELTKEVTKAHIAAEKMEIRVDEMAHTLLRVSVILERVEKRMSKLESPQS